MNKLVYPFFSPLSLLSVGHRQTSAAQASEGGRGMRVTKIHSSGAVTEFSSKVSYGL